jgi:hypothetical protein
MVSIMYFYIQSHNIKLGQLKITDQISSTKIIFVTLKQGQLFKIDGNNY